MARFRRVPIVAPSVRVVTVSLLMLELLSGSSSSARLLVPDLFAYDSVAPFATDEIERDLLYDGRSWSFDGPEVLSPGNHDDTGYFQSDVNLAALRPISATPPFTLDPSYISPAVVVPARAKRANRWRKKPTKRHSYAKEHDEYEEEGKQGSDEAAVTKGDIEEYEARYEKFIAEHFDDGEGEQRREQSAPQRKAPGSRGRAESGEEDEDEREEGNAGRDKEEGDGTDGDYRFDRFDYAPSDDYERIKAESEEQSRRLAKDPRNCRSYEKDGMVCSVCHDPASDSASESCAFATEPHHRKYAYVKERNYDSKHPKAKAEANQNDNEEDEEEEEDRDGDGEEHELSDESRSERQTTTDHDTPPPAPTTTTTTVVPKRRRTRPLRKPMLRAKPHQLATNGGGYRYQPPAVDLRSNRASMKLRSAEQPEAGSNDDIYVMDYGDGDDVARVLAEFKARDWSNCRKGKRPAGQHAGADHGLTCYQCLDAAGVNHEECMYVSESRQVATGIALPPADAAKLRKRKKVVPLRKESLRSGAIRDIGGLAPQPGSAATGDGSPALEKQTVKRTVSFRSFVSGSGTPSGRHFPLAADASERVIHYEHHISHEMP